MWFDKRKLPNEIDMFEWNLTSSCSSLSPNKKEICFRFFQSPSRRRWTSTKPAPIMKWLWRLKKEKNKSWCSYLAAKYLSKGKKTTSSISCIKVFFDTERLSVITWAILFIMISGFASWMMFGRATLPLRNRVRDACHNLYQSKRFSGPQSDRLHSRWMRIKSFTLYSTTHPRAFGFIILFFFCRKNAQNGGESLLAAQSQSSRWSNLSLIYIPTQHNISSGDQEDIEST